TGALVVERQDHRLDDGVDADGGAGVGPAFEIVAGGKVPGGRVGGGVGAQAVVDADLGLGERPGEVQVGRRVENGVRRGEEEQRVDRAVVEVLDQCPDVTEAFRFGGKSGQRLAFADVAELPVDR